MDAAHVNKTRKFPAYSLRDLEEAVAKWYAGTHPLQARTSAAHIAEIEQEIANRKAGISIHFKVPQVG